MKFTLFASIAALVLANKNRIEPDEIVQGQTSVVHFALEEICHSPIKKIEIYTDPKFTSNEGVIQALSVTGWKHHQTPDAAIYSNIHNHPDMAFNAPFNITVPIEYKDEIKFTIDAECKDGNLRNLIHLKNPEVPSDEFILTVASLEELYKEHTILEKISNFFAGVGEKISGFWNKWF